MLTPFCDIVNTTLCYLGAGVPLADELRRLRLAAGLTQQQLADRLGDVRQSYISNLEKGRNRSVSMAVLPRLAAALGVPVSAISRHLPADKPAGREMSTTFEIKGEVEAGKPIAPYDGEAVQMVSLREHFPSGCFLLRVRGDSMEGFGIHPGDLVVVRPTRSTADVNDGDIVVAQMDGGYTLKAADKRSDTDITLYALYKGKPARRVRPDDGDGVSLVGVVVKVLGDRKVPPSRRPKGAE